MQQLPCPPCPKKVKKNIAHPLQLLYKASLNTGKLPVDLKQANITPIQKGGSRNLLKNYCPIALTSHLIKILEIITNSLNLRKESQATWLPTLADPASPSYWSITTRYGKVKQWWGYLLRFCKRFWESRPWHITEQLKKEINVSLCDELTIHNFLRNKWSSSQKWCTPRVSVITPPIPNRYIWHK